MVEDLFHLQRRIASVFVKVVMIVYWLKRILYLCLIALCLSATAYPSSLPLVAHNVDLERYMGTWYEIAAFPNFFQRGCHCSQAHYLLDGQTVRILNQCYKGKQRQLKDARAKAWRAKGGRSSQLKVQFFWPFRADYWILYVSSNYQEAIVGSPNRRYLWFLSRNKQIPQKRYQYLLSVAKKRGYDIDKLHLSDQQCAN